MASTMPGFVVLPLHPMACHGATIVWPHSRPCLWPNGGWDGCMVAFAAILYCWIGRMGTDSSVSSRRLSAAIPTGGDGTRNGDNREDDSDRIIIARIFFRGLGFGPTPGYPRGFLRNHCRQHGAWIWRMANKFNRANRQMGIRRIHPWVAGG